ncbi:MAG: hypothetical protein ACK5V3_03060 [Bdellovibrionales bacterium]
MSQILLSKIDQFQSKILIPELKSHSSVIHFLNSYHWKGHTDRIRRALIHWHLGLYPLVLYKKIPNPKELLELQAQGKRVVTVFFEAEDWKKEWGKFSAWEFTVHDLIHADHFFQDPHLHQQQTRFYNFILQNWQHPFLSPLHTQSGFEYLISDMNSHPQHLLQTLSALVIEQRKKELNLSIQERLPTSEELNCQNEFRKWETEIGL